MKLFTMNQPKIKAALYGVPGCGKSTLIDSANEDERSAPVLHLNCAGNPVVAVRKPRRYIVNIETLKDLNPWYTLLKADRETDPVKPFLDYWEERDNIRPKFKTVAIDHLTELQSRQFDVVLGNENVELGGTRNQATRTKYGVLLAQMTQLARMFYALPMHVILAMWEGIEMAGEPPNQRIAGYRPSLIGQAADIVPGFAQVLIRQVPAGNLSALERKSCNDKKVSCKYNVGFFAPLKSKAKDNWGQLGDVMGDPDVTKILDKLEV